ncbi:hypothetical protein [Gallaecimonas sp. GXIMD4217]|uniref:hypothetical protein n=1 Tax=Gallaecimonas sp. GXIMD4217 TaxID=3131927 RepID=UPI00311B2425
MGSDNCTGDWASCGHVTGPEAGANGDHDPTDGHTGGNSEAHTFVQDPDGVSGIDDIYTGGGSKDDLDVSQWKWTTGTVPDKDDLLPVGAAAYNVDSDMNAATPDDLVITFFGTLFAPNGSAAAGMWLFKDNVILCTDSRGNGVFGVDNNDDGICDTDMGGDVILAEHQVGDILVQADTTVGGTVVTMNVFKWVGGLSNAEKAIECPAGMGFSLFPPKDNLCQLATLASATCSGGADDACGTMNLVATESPDSWGFQSKFPPDTDPAVNPAHPTGTDGIDIDDFPATSFLEGGFNLSALLGEDAGCFSSFLMSTRSSHSVRAQLKDLALGKFSLCDLALAKQCDADFNEDASAVIVNFSGVIENTGSLAFDITLSDGEHDIGDVCLYEEEGDPAMAKACADANDLPNEAMEDITDGVATFILGPGQKFRYEGSYTVDDPVFEGDGIATFEDTVTAEARLVDSEQLELTREADATCTLEGLPGIAVTKSCDSATIQDNGTDIKVLISGTGSNDGQVKLVNMELVDSEGATITKILVDTDDDGDLTDETDQSASNGSIMLTPGQIFSYEGELLLEDASSSDGSTLSHSDTVTAKADSVFDDDGAQDDAEDTASANCDAPHNPSILVDKNCEAAVVDDGEGTDLLITITGGGSNTGNTRLVNMELVDSKGATITEILVDTDDDGDLTDETDQSGSNGSIELNPGQIFSYMAELTVANATSAAHDDTITAKADSYFDDDGAQDDASDTGDAECEAEVILGLNVTKSCEAFLDGGDTFRAEIVGTATSASNVLLKAVNLVDDTLNVNDFTVVYDSDKDGIIDGGEPAFSLGSDDLKPGEQLAFAYTLTSTSQTSHEDTIFATGTAAFTEEAQSDAVESGTATATCQLQLHPDLSITKICDSELGGENTDGSGVILEIVDGMVAVRVGNIITVTNTGDEDLDPVTLSDSEVAMLMEVIPAGESAKFVCQDKTDSTDASCTGSLGIGESVQFRQTYKPDGLSILGWLTAPSTVEFSNTATADGAGKLSGIPIGEANEVPDPGPRTATAECPLCPPHDTE